MRLLAPALIVFLAPFSAHAVTFNFEAEITRTPRINGSGAPNLDFSGLERGSTFIGSLSYDENQVVRDQLVRPGGAIETRYSDLTISLNLPTGTVILTRSIEDYSSERSAIGVFDQKIPFGPTGDTIGFSAVTTSIGSDGILDDSGFQVLFRNPDATALTSSSLPSTIDLTQFTDPRFNGRIEGLPFFSLLDRDFFRNADGYISENGALFQGHITSFTIAPVPLPPSLPLMLVGLLGLGVMARRAA